MRPIRIVAVLALALAAQAVSLPRPLALRPDAAPPHGPPPRDPTLPPPWFAPDTSTWWQRAWGAWNRGWRRVEPLHPVTVRPLLPSGALADPAELWLPHSQLSRESPGLAPLHPDPPSAARPPPPSDPAPWFSYNSSAATPLVPTSLSWMTDTGEMAERATEGSFDLGVAHGLSRLVAAAYCAAPTLPAWNCTRCDRGFTPKTVIFDPLWDLQGFVGWSDPLNAIVVAFRGTDSRSYYNWVENMRTWRTDLALTYEGMPSRALVHGGFFYSYNASYLAANVSGAVAALVAERTRDPAGGADSGGGEGGDWLAELSTGSTAETPRKKGDHDDRDPAPPWAPTVYIAGHSMGGALATLAALDLKASLGLPDVRVVSFGSPRVGNYVFAKWFEAVVGPHWRFTHNRDIVPSVPPGYMGFYHVAQEVWMVDVLAGRTLLGVCDGSGEDPRCHSSVCHLGLCSSVADHLMYLSPMYTPRPPTPGC